MIAHMTRPNNTRLAVACVLAATLGLGIGVALTLRRRWSRNAARHTEAMRDETLQDTFPASDPPASQYFGIPANRL